MASYVRISRLRRKCSSYLPYVYDITSLTYVSYCIQLNRLTGLGQEYNATVTIRLLLRHHFTLLQRTPNLRSRIRPGV
jgi:hypothetical protein